MRAFFAQMSLDNKRQKNAPSVRKHASLKKEKETELHSAMGFFAKGPLPPQKNRRKMSTPAALLSPSP